MCITSPLPLVRLGGCGRQDRCFWDPLGFPPAVSIKCFELRAKALLRISITPQLALCGLGAARRQTHRFWKSSGKIPSRKISGIFRDSGRFREPSRILNIHVRSKGSPCNRDAPPKVIQLEPRAPPHHHHVQYTPTSYRHNIPIHSHLDP